MIVEPDRRQRIARLTPLADVLARLDALVRPVAPRTAELAAALGQTLAEDVIIHAPVPATALALRDGWAVSSDLTTDASAYAPAPLPSAVWVDVGQPLPGDADAVAPIDGVVIRDGAAQALAPVGPGEGALPTGADVARGTTLLPAGRRLGRIEIALLAAASVAETRVRAPRLHLVHASPTLSPRKAALPPLPHGIAWPMHWPRQARMRSWSWAAPAAARTTPHCIRSPRSVSCSSTGSGCCLARPRPLEPSARDRCWHCRGGSMRRWPLGTCWVG